MSEESFVELDELIEKAAQRKRLSPEERAGRKAVLEQQRAERNEERARKAQEREDAKNRTNYEKGLSKLPVLSELAESLRFEVVQNLSFEEVSALVEHLKLVVKDLRSENAANFTKPEVGEPVTWTTRKGYTRTGVVTRCGRTRCWVSSEGESVYLSYAEISTLNDTQETEQE